jgi:hypothetical protein
VWTHGLHSARGHAVTSSSGREAADGAPQTKGAIMYRMAEAMQVRFLSATAFSVTVVQNAQTLCIAQVLSLKICSKATGLLARDCFFVANVEKPRWLEGRFHNHMAKHCCSKNKESAPSALIAHLNLNVYRCTVC